MKTRDAAMKAINAALEPIHVLRLDDSTGTYTLGYMVGAMRASAARRNWRRVQERRLRASRPQWGKSPSLRCRHSRKRHDQTAAAAAAGRKKWDCVAPKMVGNLEGHRAGTMSEKFFSPRGGTVTVKYLKEMKIVTESFSTGATVPSCDTCQDSRARDALRHLQTLPLMAEWEWIGDCD